MQLGVQAHFLLVDEHLTGGLVHVLWAESAIQSHFLSTDHEFFPGHGPDDGLLEVAEFSDIFFLVDSPLENTLCQSPLLPEELSRVTLEHGHFRDEAFLLQSPLDCIYLLCS